MDDPLRTAVVGCGGAGQHHATGYEAADGAQLVGVCDVDADRARTLADAFDVPSTTDIDRLLTDHAPDLVSITTPERHHVEPTIAALEAGADVLCEKIMADSFEGAQRMVAAADRTGRTLAVNYNYRHMPAFARIAAAIDRDVLGPVRLVTVDVQAYGWHHALDLLRFLVDEPTGVTATMIHDREAIDDRFVLDGPLYLPTDGLSATFTLPRDSIATVSSSIHSSLEEHLIDLAVYGEDGRVRTVGMTPDDSTGTVAPGRLRAALEECESISLAQSFHRSVAAVVEAIRAGEDPPTTGADGLRLVELETAVYDAAVGDERIGL